MPRRGHLEPGISEPSAPGEGDLMIFGQNILKKHCCKGGYLHPPLNYLSPGTAIEEKSLLTRGRTAGWLRSKCPAGASESCWLFWRI